jgi:hypothetical protein
LGQYRFDEVMAKTGFRTPFTIRFHSVAAYGYGVIWTQLPQFLHYVPAIAIRQINIRDENMAVRPWNFPQRLRFATRRKTDVLIARDKSEEASKVSL